jgi:threonine-phosphate decarboxylase
MIKGHGGNIFEVAQRLGCAPTDIYDMSSNVNPLGPPTGLVAFLLENIHTINALPEVDAGKAVRAFADRYDVDPDLVLAGNGTTQFIYSIPQALQTKRALILGPTYADYADACNMHKVSHSFVLAEESDAFQPDLDPLSKHIQAFDTVFICNPNNPTGTIIPVAELELICSANPHTYFVIDESYLPFVHDGEKESMLNSGLTNVIVLNSMSKIFRIPGLRIGFLRASENTIEKFTRYTLPWSANSLAQHAVSYLMENTAEVESFIEETRTFIETERKHFTETFRDIPEIRIYPSTTSFLLARLFENYIAEDVCAYLLQSRILIRNCSNFKGLSDRFIRIAFKTREINALLEERLLTCFNR